MSDPLSITASSSGPRSIAGNEYWQIAREIKKQESIYPKHSLAEIKAAVQFAFSKGGQRFDAQQVDRFVAMYLTAGDLK